MIIVVSRDKLAILAVLFLALILRFHQYGEFPRMGETKDEFAWSWLGMSLLSGNEPTSWSWFDHYPDSYMLSLGEGGNQADYRIVSPVFDNPPTTPKPISTFIVGFFR